VTHSLEGCCSIQLSYGTFLFKDCKITTINAKIPNPFFIFFVESQNVLHLHSNIVLFNGRHLKKEIQRSIVIALLTLIPFGFQGSESIEVLIQKLEASEGIERIDLLIDLSERMLNQNPDKAIEFGNDALSLAVNLQSKLHEAKSFFRIAEGYRLKGENIRALDNFLKALKTYGEIDDREGVAKSSNQTGKIYRFMGDYSTALDHHLRALKIYTDLENKKGIAISMISSGDAYQKLEKSDLALDYFNQAIEMCKGSNDQTTIVDAYISKGDLHWHEGDNDRALYFFEEALKILKSIDQPGIDSSVVINNLGNVYREKEDYNVALNYYDQSLRLSTNAGDKNLIAVIQKNIGITYKLTGEYQRAIDFLKMSKDLAGQIRLQEVYKESLEELSESYALAGNYKNALEYYKELAILNQQVAQEQASNKISLIQLGYHLKDEAQKQTIREIDLNLRVLKERNIRNIIILFTLFSIAFIFILWSRYRMKLRTNTELTNLNTDLEKRVEERTKRLKEENDRRKIAHEHAQQANESKNRFLANISHEVRTPITAIIGFCDITIQSGVGEQHKIYLQRIKDSSEHLLALIKDLLDYSQIDIGKTELKKTTFHLKELMESVINAFFLDAKSKKLKMVLDIHEKVPLNLMGDKDVIRQIMYNLIGNAVKFTEEGDVKIKIRVSENGSENDKIKLLCSVEDTGIGISRMKQKLIFMDFSQESESTNRKYGGAGLGLTISKHFIQLMEGEIWVESEKGKGSNFLFTMVLMNADTAAHKLNARNAEVKKLHILIAEDNMLNSQVITAFLTRLGHTSEMAVNGIEAIRILSEKDFDAVLMDIEMPEMDGIEATEKIRMGIMDVRNPNIPIIALTAHALKDYEEKSLKAGMNSYLTKPVDIAQLSQVLQSL
jgi:signal transduction histidine kinase/ActR/RegA family two-component response regulator